MFLTGCQKLKKLEENGKAQQAYQRQQEMKLSLARIASNIQYMKDKRTGLCFAYLWSSHGTCGGSQTMATVPCEAIPLDLLTVGQ